MLPVMINQKQAVAGKRIVFGGEAVVLPQAIPGQRDGLMDDLLTTLAQDSSWGNRQKAARKLGNLRNPAAVSGLLTTLPADPFWMVRYAIIQALEKIGDPRAITTLQRVAHEDAFLTVRCQATMAIETLARQTG